MTCYIKCLLSRKYCIYCISYSLIIMSKITFYHYVNKLTLLIISFSSLKSQLKHKLFALLSYDCVHTTYPVDIVISKFLRTNVFWTESRPIVYWFVTFTNQTLTINNILWSMTFTSSHSNQLNRLFYRVWSSSGEWYGTILPFVLSCFCMPWLH